MDATLIREACANRAFLYRYLWCLFAVSPDEKLIELCASPEVAEAVELLCPQGSEGFDAQAALADLARAAMQDDGLAGLKSDYTKLFVGPGSLPAAPWESVFTSSDGLLFQASTLEVRSSYKAAGFVSAGYPKEADDALATELDFMRALTERAMDLLEKGAPHQAGVLLRHQMLFLDEHLNAWLGKFAAQLAEKKPPRVGEFYLHAAWLAQYICHEDRQAVDELQRACEALAAGAK